MFDTLGNIGDFIGGIGVIVTVIYLALQVRNGTASTKGASYQAAVTAVSDWSRTIGADPELTRIMRIGMEQPDGLSDNEYSQFEMLVVSATRNFENIHFQYISGGISEAVWKGWSIRIVGFFSQPGLKSWWEHHKTAYSDDFNEFVETGRKTASDGPAVMSKPAPPNKSLETDA